MINTNDYSRFVSSVTSAPSTNYEDLVERLNELNESGVNVPKLMTSYTGICAEAGEYAEVVKKILFQGKPYNEDNVFHMKREIGDILFYISLACEALGFSIDEALQMNVEKLSARYPNGLFEANKSENRAEGDV
jgi:NTP pyrophosphatase (non-canonical NTP hydrolase)